MRQCYARSCLHMAAALQRATAAGAALKLGAAAGVRGSVIRGAGSFSFLRGALLRMTSGELRQLRPLRVCSRKAALRLLHEVPRRRHGTRRAAERQEVHL